LECGCPLPLWPSASLGFTDVLIGAGSIWLGLARLRERLAPSSKAAEDCRFGTATLAFPVRLSFFVLVFADNPLENAGFDVSPWHL